MNKRIKIMLITLLVLFNIIVFDTTQAKVFNNKPFLKIVESYDGGTLHQKHKGILVDTYIYNDGNMKTFFKWETRLY